jgi:hypothetical protein
MMWEWVTDGEEELKVNGILVACFKAIPICAGKSTGNPRNITINLLGYPTNQCRLYKF